MPVYTQNTKGPQSQLSLHTICGILWQFQAVYYIRDATCFSNVAISTLKYFQLHPIFSPIAPQCQIPIWYVFFLFLLSLSKRFAQKCIFLFAKTYPQLVITPWSWAMSAIKFVSRKSKHGVFVLVPTQKVPSVVEWMIKSLQKVKVRVKTSHLIFGYVHFHFIGWDFATFNTKNFWGGPVKKYTLCVCLKSIQLQIGILFVLNKSL